METATTIQYGCLTRRTSSGAGDLLAVTAIRQ